MPVDTTALNAAYDKIDTLSKTYMSYFKVLISLNILTIGYLVQDFQLMVYTNLRKVFVNNFNFLAMLNTSSTIIVIVWICKHYGDFSINLGGYRDELKVSVIIQRMNDDNSFNIRVTLAILTAIQ